MRALAWGLGGVALLAGAFALARLLDPYPAGSDAPALAVLGLALLLAFTALALDADPRAWWRWWIPAAWLGLDVAALFLAYKDSFVAELAYFGPLELAWHVLLHMLLAPITVALGFLVGFVDPQGGLVVLACVGVALLGAELLRRRLWPREREAGLAQRGRA